MKKVGKQRMSNHHPCYKAGQSKKCLILLLWPQQNLPPLSSSFFFSQSVSPVDGPQSATVFPLCWLIFQAPPPLDATSPSSNSSNWVVLFQSLNRINISFSSIYLEVIVQQSGFSLQVRWEEFCHCQQIRLEHRCFNLDPGNYWKCVMMENSVA